MQGIISDIYITYFRRGDVMVWSACVIEFMMQWNQPINVYQTDKPSQSHVITCRIECYRCTIRKTLSIGWTSLVCRARLIFSKNVQESIKKLALWEEARGLGRTGANFDWMRTFNGQSDCAALGSGCQRSGGIFHQSGIASRCSRVLPPTIYA